MDLKVQKMLAETVANANKNTVSPYTTKAEVTSITGDTVYVKIPGSENATPVKASSVSVKVGDIVDLMVSHSDTHITGNRSDVAVSSTTAESITQTMETSRLEMENELDIVGNKMKILNNNIDMQNNTINMQNNTITQMGNTIDQQNNTITQMGNTIDQQNNTITQFGNTIEQHGNTITEIDDTVTSQGNTITQMNSAIETLDSTVETQGSSIQTMNSAIETLDSTVETQGSSIQTMNSAIETLDSTVETQGSSIQTMNSAIETLDSTVETQGSSIQTLDSSIKIVNSAFVIQNGKLTGISEIMTNLLDSDYVTTDLLNADVAWIENGKIKQGAIGTVEIADSSITTAKISELSADVIKTGTLKTECLILTTDEVDPETGEKKVALITALNAKTKAGEGNILDGAVIKDETIEAAKITVVDLNAFGATIGNFHIGTSSMYNNKTSLTDPTDGVYIGTDGIALGQGSLLNMTDDSPFRVESDGDFHLGGKDSNYINFDPFSGELDINAKTIKMGSKGIATSEDVTDKADSALANAKSYTDAQIQVTSESITSTVSKTYATKTDLSTTNSNVTNAQSTANSAKTAAEEAKADVNSLTNRVTAAETKISQNSESISLRATKTEVTDAIDGIQIGGRNLARNTSSDFMATPFTDFNGELNICPPLARVYTTNLKVGDTITVQLVYKYENIVPVDGKDALCWIQGPGDVTGWGAGGLYAPGFVLNGSGEYIIEYCILMSEDHLRNTFWDTNIRHDYIQSGSVNWKCFKVEKGNKATDWTPAPEDIEENATTKANNAKAEAISAVNETLKSYATLDITDNKISSAVTESKAYTDAIQIGGRNLFRQSGHWDTKPTWWVDNGGGLELDTSVQYMGYNTIKTIVGGGIVGNYNRYFEVDTNKIYTYSAMIKLTGDNYTGAYTTPLHYHCSSTGDDYGQSGGVDVIKYKQDLVNGEWTLLYLTFRPKGKYFRPYVFIGYGTRVFNIAYLKLEEGNKATDWTPAPEDIEENATTKANGAVTEAKSYVDQTAESIKSTVQDVNGRLTTMEQNASGFTWTIDETAIVSSVNEYYQSTSPTSLSGDSWSENAPEWTQGTYIWIRIKTTNGKGKVDYSKPVCITGNTGAQGTKGDTGEQGPKGEKGDTGAKGATGADGRGIIDTTVTYQEGSSGTTVPTGTWSPNVPSVSAGQYLWTKTVTTYTSGDPTTSYSVGRMGTNGQNGTNGINGTDGKGIKSTDITYKAWSSGTTTPTGTWYTSVPSTTADEPYLWTKTVITYTDNTTSTSYSVGSTPEGIIVGGRNLFRQSGHWTTEPTWWVDNGGGLELDTSVQYMGYNTIKTIVGGGIVGNYNRYFELDTNKIYTYSAMIKLTGDDYPGAYTTPLHYHCSSTGDDYGQSGGVDVIKHKQNLVNGEWNLLYLTFRPKGKYFRPFVFLGGGSNRVFNIAYLKLEEGNKATDWTPAPEDVAADAEAKANNAKSEAITAAADDATNKANEAAKTATNYMNFSTDGLVVGDMTASTLGKNVIIDSDSVDIRSGTKVLASYGEDITLYKNGMKAFTIKDSELLKNAVDLNNTFKNNSSIVTSDGIEIITSVGGPITLEIGKMYKWSIITKNSIKHYIVITPEQTYNNVTEMVWSEASKNLLSIVYGTGTKIDIPCVYLDNNAMIDLSLNGSVWINNNGDLNGKAKGLPPLSIGTNGGEHLEIDSNEITAKTDDTTPSNLDLNMEGGYVSVNSNYDRSLKFQGGTIYAKKLSGTYADKWLKIIDGFNTSNNTTFGYGNYSNSIGETSVYGYEVNNISKTRVVLKSEHENVNLTVGGDHANISTNTSFLVSNNKGFVGTNKSGDLRNNFQPCDADNKCVIGYDSYTHKEGATNIYGDYLSLTTNNSYIMNNKAMSIPAISVHSVTTQVLNTSVALIAVGNFDSTDNQTTIGSTYFKTTLSGVRCLLSGWVKVSAQISLTGLNTNDGVYLYIYKNSTEMYSTYARLNTSGEISIIDHVFKVAANDVIYIYARNITAARGTISNNWYGASLTIAYVN